MGPVGVTSSAMVGPSKQPHLITGYVLPNNPCSQRFPDCCHLRVAMSKIELHTKPQGRLINLGFKDVCTLSPEPYPSLPPPLPRAQLSGNDSLSGQATRRTNRAVISGHQYLLKAHSLEAGRSLQSLRLPSPAEPPWQLQTLLSAPSRLAPVISARWIMSYFSWIWLQEPNSI